MTDLANNKGKAISDEEMSKAAGGYIVDGGLFYKDKVYDSKGYFTRGNRKYHDDTWEYL